MYVPAHFRRDGSPRTRLAAVRTHAFETFWSDVDGAPFARIFRCFTGAKSSSDPRRALGEAQSTMEEIERQSRVLILHGPHAYVSPRWYVEPSQNVPTWNYAAAHVYGQCPPDPRAAKLATIVSGLAENMRAVPRHRGVRGFERRTVLRGIVGFELVAQDDPTQIQAEPEPSGRECSGHCRPVGAGRGRCRAVAGLMQDALDKRR